MMPTDPNKSDQELAPTPAGEWGKQSSAVDDGFLVTLPSGNRAKVRRTLDLPVLLKAGKIPNPLAGIIQRMIDTGDPSIDTSNMTPKALQQLLDLLDSTVERVMIQPRVSRPLGQQPTEDWDQYLERIQDWEPEPDTISVFDVEMNDKLFLFSLAQGAAADLESFRDEQTAALGAVQAGTSVGSAPEPTGGAAGPNRAARRAKKPAKAT